MKQLLGKDLKSVGQVEIDLAEFCGEGETSRNITLKLQKCSDKSAFIKCTMKSRWLKQLADGADDTASQMSGASSVDARSESAMPGPHGSDVADINDLDGMEEAQDEEDGNNVEDGADDEPSQTRSSYMAATPSSATAAAMSTPSRMVAMPVSLHVSPAPSPAVGGANPSQAAVASLQSQLTLARQSIATKDATLTERTNEIDSLKQKVSELTHAVNSTRSDASKVSILQTQLLQLQESYDNLNRDKHELEMEHESELVRCKSETSTLMKQNEIQRDELKRLKEELQQTRQEVERSKSGEPSPTSGSGGVVVAGAGAVGVSNEYYEKQLKDLRAELSQATTLTHEAFARLELQDTKLTTMVSEHSSELLDKEKDVRHLEDLLEESETKLVEFEERLKTNELQLIDTRRSEKESKNDISLLQSSLKIEIQRREQCETSLDESEKLIQDGKTMFKKLEIEKENEFKLAKQQWQNEKEKLVAELNEAKNGGGSAAVVAVGASTSSSSSVDSDLLSSLEKKVSDYSQRLTNVEEERLRLETECLTLESTLSKQKEDELLLLEERYEETYKYKKIIKEKENEVEELQRGSREVNREVKELRVQVEKGQKDIREKIRLNEVQEQSLEQMNHKLSKSQEDMKKLRILIDTSTTRVRELEMKLQESNEKLHEIERQLVNEKELSDKYQRQAQTDSEIWSNERRQMRKELEEATREAQSAAAAAAASSASTSPPDEDGADGDGGDTTKASSSSSSSSELAQVHELLTRRSLELSEQEMLVEDLRMKLRNFEDVQTRMKYLEQQLKENEALHMNKVTQLEKERLEYETTVKVLKEKREKDREKLFEREQREKELRLQTVTQVSELTQQVASLTDELNQTRIKCEDLQESVVSKSSKLSELQDRLQTCTRSLETLQRETSELKELCTMLTTKLETATTQINQSAQRWETEKETHAKEKGQLEKALSDLQSRRLIFEQLSAEAQSALQKDKVTVALTDSLQKKIQFYEDQLSDSDESMTLAKSSWQATSKVLVEQVESLELQVSRLKIDSNEALESKGMDLGKIAALEGKIKKCEKDKSKLSELMSRFEVELTSKKCELAASLDQLSTQEYENEKLKTQLSKQLKICETHVAELNKRP